jgi:hypothetical protein
MIVLSMPLPVGLTSGNQVLLFADIRDDSANADIKGVTTALPILCSPNFSVRFHVLNFFLIGIVWGVESNCVHSALRPLIGLLCQSRVIMMMEELVE